MSDPKIHNEKTDDIIEISEDASNKKPCGGSNGSCKEDCDCQNQQEKSCPCSGHNDHEESSRDDEIVKLQTEIAEIKDQYVRKVADMDNFRKRLIEDQKNNLAFANERMLMDILTLMDNFDRALTSTKESKNFDTLYQGLILSEKEFFSTLKTNYQLESFGEVDEEFDPHKHEALSIEKTDNEQEGELVILDVFQKGYTYKGKVLRPAKVKITKK